MCELLVGLPAVRVLGVVDEADGPLFVHIETTGERPDCPGCGGRATVKERDAVTPTCRRLGDRPGWCGASIAGHARTRLCAWGSWTGEEPTIAAPRLVLTDRAGRWVTEQVGRCGRSVDEIGVELGCDWHTVNDAVIAYGTALIDDDPDRIGEPTAVGLDETLFARVGRWRTQVVVDLDRQRPCRSAPRRRRWS